MYVIILLSLQVLAVAAKQTTFEGYQYERPKPVYAAAHNNNNNIALAALEIPNKIADQTEILRADTAIMSVGPPPGVASDFIDDLIVNHKQKIVASIFGGQLTSSAVKNLYAQGKTTGFLDAATTTGIFKKCATCTCGLPNVNRIVGGRQVRTNKYPWITQLLMPDTFFCGGTLINDRYILTAAHCVHELSSNITVRILQYDRGLPQDGIIRAVSEIIMHAQYNPTTMEHDIALLRLNESIALMNPIRPVCLPNINQNFDFKEAVVAGWGLSSELAESTSKILQEVSVPILTNAQCKATSYKSMIVQTMLCAGYIKEGGKDACQGDSGGPLIVRDNNIYHLAGVVSFGYGCAQPNAPGVYTRVTKYLDWISARTRDACYCAK